MVWASPEDIRWTAGSAFFLWTTLWGVHGAKAELKRFLQFSFFFFFILFAERVRLWCFYVSAFAVLTELSPSHRVNYFFIYFPREHLTLPYFLPCGEELRRRGMALTWLEPACELCWLMSWDSLQLELLHKYGNPQSSLSVELNDRRMTRFIVIRFLFWKTVDRHKSCLKKKRWFIFINQYSHYCVNIMDLFYLNGSLLFLLLNYRWNILFSQKKWKRAI